MQSAQESKQELEAAIRYAENAISSAKTTIESMEFRQEMAKKQYAEQTGREEALTKQVEELESKVQGQYDDIVVLERRLTEAKTNMALMTDELEQLKEFNDELSKQNVSLAEGKPTMPIIPKDVAIAIFREGIQTGVLSACSEIEGQTINVSETGYTGDFEVSFERQIDLDDELDLDWMRDKCRDYSEDAVIDSLKGLCADNKFECRIHGVDEQES